MRFTVLRTVLYRLVGRAFLKYTAVDCTEGSFVQVGRGEQSSGILRWTELKTVLYRFGVGSILLVYCG